MCISVSIHMHTWHSLLICKPLNTLFLGSEKPTHPKGSHPSYGDQVIPRILLGNQHFMYPSIIIKDGPIGPRAWWKGKLDPTNLCGLLLTWRTLVIGNTRSICIIMLMTIYKYFGIHPLSQAIQPPSTIISFTQVFCWGNIPFKY